jgi:hypothetical protein
MDDSSLSRTVDTVQEDMDEECQNMNDVVSGTVCHLYAEIPLRLTH